MKICGYTESDCGNWYSFECGGAIDTSDDCGITWILIEEDFNFCPFCGGNLDKRNTDNTIPVIKQYKSVTGSLASNITIIGFE